MHPSGSSGRPFGVIKKQLQDSQLFLLEVVIEFKVSLKDYVRLESSSDASNIHKLHNGGRTVAFFI